MTPYAPASEAAPGSGDLESQACESSIRHSAAQPQETKAIPDKTHGLVTPCEQQDPQASATGTPRKGTPRCSASRRGLALTRSRSPSTDRDLLLLRRFQEEALGGLGALSLAQIGLVQSACRHELVARLAGNWLKEANLSIQDRLALTQRITQATDARDRCFVRLGLSPAAGKGDAGAFDFLNSIPEPFEPQEATQ